MAQISMIKISRWLKCNSKLKEGEVNKKITRKELLQAITLFTAESARLIGDTGLI